MRSSSSWVAALLSVGRYEDYEGILYKEMRGNTEYIRTTGQINRVSIETALLF